MNSILLLFLLIVYLGALFFIAQWAEKHPNSKWVNNPYIYTLSLAVYCTAWTYYGSIGVAASSGIGYLSIYIGPLIVIPSWIYVMAKMNKIARLNKISSVADFISLRYGNSRFLGALVTVVCLISIVPYISLQLKAISETFNLVTDQAMSSFVFNDSTTYIAIALALFATYYGTRYTDASAQRSGMLSSVAFESMLKLVFFLIIGVYVSFVVFDSPSDIYHQAAALPDFEKTSTFSSEGATTNWMLLNLLSAFAIFLLPRQFHVAVVENKKERNLRTALWLFPLYLLLFNLFVFPIAWGGNILFAGQEVNADTYSLLIPQLMNNKFIMVLVFFGGFSAAISMIVVSTISLSTMVSNNILIPYSLLGSLKSNNQTINSKKILNVRRVAIFSLIIMSYFIYRYFVLDYNLVSIGLVSFAIIAQLAPSFFGGLFWKDGSKKAAIAGITAGLIICAYTLLIPFVLGENDSTFITDGLGGFAILKPFSLFGLDSLAVIPHAFFWSLLFNILVYVGVSIFYKAGFRERNYANMFVDIDTFTNNTENVFQWEGTAYRKDIENVLVRFLGEKYTARAMNIYNKKYNISENVTLADANLVTFSENLLTGHIGTASARILLSSVIKEEKFTLPEVMEILDESKATKELNKKLVETSKKLQQATNMLTNANSELLIKDKQKNDFLDTVAHELRTPITAIRASVEILQDADDMPEEMREQFFNNIITEADRLNRLIDTIMDLEKFESGKQTLDVKKHYLNKSIEKALLPLEHLIQKNDIQLNFVNTRPYVLHYDEDRIIQVVTNLLGNAVKFCKPKEGRIKIDLKETEDTIEVHIADNGNGIAEEEKELIFDKFYQSNLQTTKKPIGTGLGLAICKQIVEHHNGSIWIAPKTDGACFCFSLPKKEEDE